MSSGSDTSVVCVDLSHLRVNSVFDSDSEITDPSYYDDDDDLPTPTPSPYFTTCSYKELWSEMKRDIFDVQSKMIGYSMTELRILLNLCKWDENVLLEKLTGDEATVKKLHDSAKLPFKRNKIPKVVKKSRKLETIECDVCLSDCDSSMMLRLDCGHLFCAECVEETVKQKVYDRQQVMFCLSDSCDVIIPDDHVLKLLTEEQDRVKFQNLIFESYVQNKKNLRWCPGTDCNRIFKIKTFFSTAVDVGCSRCNVNLCFKCRKEPHEPLECDIMKVWLGKQLGSSLTDMWLRAFTKQCPKCDVPINKDGGCNHMQCKECAHHFCWICLHEWKEHDDYYSCNRFSGARDERDDSKQSLERYVFYSERYNQQKQSLILEETLNFDEGLEDGADPETVRAYIRQQMFLNDAIRVLKACRTTLMNTYAFAYFLQENNQSDIFEDNQSDLQKHVELLSEFLEKDARKYEDDKVKALKDKVKYCDERRNKLVDHVKEHDWDFRNL